MTKFILLIALLATGAVQAQTLLEPIPAMQLFLKNIHKLKSSGGDQISVSFSRDILSSETEVTKVSAICEKRISSEICTIGIQYFDEDKGMEEVGVKSYEFEVDRSSGVPKIKGNAVGIFGAGSL